jgi:hypothetical protein
MVRGRASQTKGSYFKVFKDKEKFNPKIEQNILNRLRIYKADHSGRLV